MVATKHCGVPSSLNPPEAFLEQKTRVEGSVAKFVPEDSQRTPLLHWAAFALAVTFLMWGFVHVEGRNVSKACEIPSRSLTQLCLK